MDEAAVVTDRFRLEGVERERLLQALSELCNEVRCEARGVEIGSEVFARTHRSAVRLGAADEQLAVELSAGLARLAKAAGSRRGERVEALPAAAVQRRLDGAESVMRRKIRTGQSERLPQLLPSFVFLVLLPLLGQAEALRICQRAVQLLETDSQPEAFPSSTLR